MLFWIILGSIVGLIVGILYPGEKNQGKRLKLDVAFVVLLVLIVYFI